MKEDSGWASVGLVTTCIALLVLAVWMAAFFYQAAVPHPSLDALSQYALSKEFKSRSVNLSELLNQSSLTALLIFSHFLIIDISILRMMKKIEESRDGNFLSEHHAELKKVRVAGGVARGSIWYVDIPGIVAGIFLFAVSFWIEGLHQIANGITDLGAAVFQPYKWDGRSFANVEGPIDAITLTFNLGFAAGVHILQLFLSQLIFAIIVVRSELIG